MVARYQRLAISVQLLLILLTGGTSLHKISAKSQNGSTTEGIEPNQTHYMENTASQTRKSAESTMAHKGKDLPMEIADYMKEENAETERGFRNVSKGEQPVNRQTQYKSDNDKGIIKETELQNVDIPSHGQHEKVNGKQRNRAATKKETSNMKHRWNHNSGSTKQSQMLRNKRYTEEGFPQKLLQTSIACPTEECDCRVDINGSYILNCRFKPLTRIPSFTTVDTVFKLISFYNNNITKVEQLNFQNLKVEKIDLINIPLSKIEDGAFIGLETVLTELALQGNGQIAIPFQQISNLNKLEILELKNFHQNRLTYLPSNFEYLTVLKLNKINITGIGDSAFVNRLPRLRELIIEFDGSSMSQIPVRSLLPIKTLQSLSLRGGGITAIYDQTFESFHLKSLDLHRNRIRIIKPDAFLGISNSLERLDLSFNKFDRISLEALSSKTWVELKYLHLSYNNLQFIPGNVFRNMPKLQYLMLEEIHLTQVSPNLFGGLNNLHALDLSYNRIRSINANSFAHMRYLSELKLNKQFYIYGKEPLAKDVMLLERYSFYGLEHSLLKLDVESSPLYVNQFWDAISPLESLQELIANKARITHIPDNCFSSNTKLSKLELGHNGISQITQGSMWNLRNSLQSISLHSNPMKTISECVFKNFSHLNFISLHENPLNCDCKLQWLQEFITKKQVNASLYQYMYVCNEPSHFKGSQLSKIPTASLECQDSEPEICQTFITTEMPTTKKTTVLTSTSKPVPNTLTLLVASAQNILLVQWSVQDRKSVTGYVLEYYALINDKSRQSIKIHKDNTEYSLTGLQPGMFYKVCVTAEVNNAKDENIHNCRTVQTQSEQVDTGSYTGGDDSEDTGKERNIIIGVILASVVVVILVIVGICSIVKYKMQKLKTIQMTMGLQAPRVLYASSEGLFDENKKCAIYTVGNDYTDIKDAQLKSNYNTLDIKKMLTGAEIEENKAARSYSTYQRGKRHNKQKHPAVPAKSTAENLDVDADIQGDKDNLGTRHSAPSRIEDSSNQSQGSDRRSSRPLPALPSKKQKSQNKTKDREEKTNQNQHQVLTQASVYENKVNKSTDLLCNESDDEQCKT